MVLGSSRALSIHHTPTPRSDTTSPRDSTGSPFRIVGSGVKPVAGVIASGSQTHPDQTDCGVFSVGLVAAEVRKHLGARIPLARAGLVVFVHIVHV